jgi:hypothetical protein
MNSCYNAFSHLDMRVEVKIPGTLESYCIDERGDKRVATEALFVTGLNRRTPTIFLIASPPPLSAYE